MSFTPSPDQERLFSEAITKICSQLNDHEIIDVLPRTLYLRKDRTWDWRCESIGCSLGEISLERALRELLCYKASDIDLDDAIISDQQAFDMLFQKFIVHMNETRDRLHGI